MSKLIELIVNLLWLKETSLKILKLVSPKLIVKEDELFKKLISKFVLTSIIFTFLVLESELYWLSLISYISVKEVSFMENKFLNILLLLNSN